MVAAAFGFKNICAVTGQTYQRKIDTLAINALASIAQSAQKLCTDLRLLANLKEIEEPFEKSQVGSSAYGLQAQPDAMRKSNCALEIRPVDCHQPRDDRFPAMV